jgi:hypothetical protein
MTLGGSRFPGALGAMLIEILPFLRGIAVDIRNVLGPDSTALVPTVMAAYALTSFLTAFVFIMLGLLKLGNLVSATEFHVNSSRLSRKFRLHIFLKLSLLMLLVPSASRYLFSDLAL